MRSLHSLTLERYCRIKCMLRDKTKVLLAYLVSITTKKNGGGGGGGYVNNYIIHIIVIDKI